MVRKRMVSTVMSLMMAAAVLTTVPVTNNVKAADKEITSGDYTYVKESNGKTSYAVLTSYRGSETNLVIPEELDAHIHALLKLSKGEKSKDESECYKIGKEYVLDATHAILKHSSGENKTLTAREAGLLQMLCENRGDVVRREAILDKFWNTEDDYFASRSLDVFVTKLRKLIAEDSSVSIKTVKGVGLMLEENV